MGSWVTWGVGLAATIVNVILYLKSRKVKSFMYISHSTSILTEGDRPAGLRIMYGGDDVNDPVISTVRLRSTGSMEVLEEDFKSPLAVRLAETRILAVHVQKEVPDGLDVKVAASTRCATDVEVSPLMLNPSNGFDLQIVTDGMPATIAMIARVVGLKPVVRMSESGVSSKRWAVVAGYVAGAFIALLSVVFLVGGIGMLTSPTPNSGIVSVGFGGLFSVGAFMLLRDVSRARMLRKIFGEES